MLGSKEVDGRALDEAEAPQVAHFLELELQDLSRRAVQPIDFLLPEAETLHQLDVPQRLGRRPGKCRRLGNDYFLNRFDAPAQYGAQQPEHGDGQEIDRRDQPVDAERVGHHEDDPDERREQHVDRSRNEALDVGADFLQPAERLAAALILEDRVRELERVPDAVRIELRTEPLRDHVDVVVLEVLRHARDERHTHRRRRAAG